jgi:tRNA nucleotidyltransferase (CCA-adding enzyme)
MDDLAAALRRAHPELDAVRAAAVEPVFLVGGAVRDLLLGRPRADVDLVVEGDAAALAHRLGGPSAEHHRFGTVKVEVGGHELDIAAARRERYPEPGALPVVDAGETVESDLSRRDFTINAMAVPLAEPGCLIDPFGGQADLEAGLLRVLHDASFLDDPTRAIRAARYAARFGFALEPGTEELLRRAELGTISAERRRAELERLASEATAPHGFALLAGWGLVVLREQGIELAELVLELLGGGPWEGKVEPAEAVLAAAMGPAGAEVELAEAAISLPSEAVELASGRSMLELLLARALGADWLELYLGEWSQVKLEIDGADLLAAGVPQGPALGRGLEAALRAKLDGEVAGRECELEVALGAARGA